MTISVEFNGEPTQQRAFAVKLDGHTVQTLPIVYLQTLGHDNLTDENAPKFAESFLQPKYEAAFAGATFAGLKAQADAHFDTAAAKDRYTPEQRKYHAEQALHVEVSGRSNVNLRAEAQVLDLRRA